MSEDELVKIRAAAGLLGVSEGTIRNWMDAGKIGFVYLNGVSGHRRISRRELDCAVRLYGKCFAGSTCCNRPTHRALTDLIDVKARRSWAEDRAYCNLHAPDNSTELQTFLEVSR